MRADFQQHYGLNLDEMGGLYSISHAAVLAAQLPKDSRTFTAIEPASAYCTVTNQLLALIEYHSHVGWWLHTEDARNGRNRPQFVAAKPDEPGRTQGEALTIEQYRALLALPRKEVQHG